MTDDPSTHRLSNASPDLTRRSLLQVRPRSAPGVGRVRPDARTAAGVRGAARRPDDEGILVTIQMSGGNDGLNMVVPRRRRALPRPARRRSRSAERAPDRRSGLGLHPSLTQAQARCYDQGKVAIVRGVGYKPPDLCHFTSMGHLDARLGRRTAVADDRLGRPHPRRLPERRARSRSTASPSASVGAAAPRRARCRTRRRCRSTSAARSASTARDPNDRAHVRRARDASGRAAPGSAPAAISSARPSRVS